MSAWSNSIALSRSIAGWEWRNFASLAKYAASYSSPSLTNHEAEPRRVVALEDGNAELLEQGAGRRVDVLVGARHAVAGGAPEPGERAHPDPAGGDQVDPHAPSASMTASWTRGRTSRMPSLSRWGCTRLVRKTTLTARSRSIHSEVPVKPRWPTAVRDIRVPAAEPLSDGVSQPSAQVASRTVGSRVQNSRRISRGTKSSLPRQQARSRAASASTSAAFAYSPACPATPPMA